ncbi:MAG TPA: ATP synthase F1 subunit gamma, partial [Limnochordia bacterium]|nr:ATP synthase F1 subunit gamma [Limnochordia bacterium]
DIKRRQRSIKNMQQITKAMEMVSAAKLRRAESAAIAARPFARKMQEVLGRLAGSGAAAMNPTERNPDLALLHARPVTRRCICVVTSDRGLTGGFNANAIRKGIAVARESKAEVVISAVGRKGRDAFRRRGYSIASEFIGVGDVVHIGSARAVAATLMNGFKAGEYDEVILVYAVYKSAMSHEFVATKLLPVDPPESEASGTQALYEYEPSPEEVLGILIPRYVEALVFRAMLDSKASEHGARMTAMRSASDNAGEMLDALQLSFNRARQASITKEISEIVGGANALSGA